MSCNSECAEVWHGWAQLAALYIFTDLSVLPANTRRTFTDPSVLAANAHIVVHIAPTFLTTYTTYVFHVSFVTSKKTFFIGKTLEKVGF